MNPADPEPPSVPTLRRVLVVGAGTVGRQFALQCAAFGLPVVLHDHDPRQLEAAAAERPELIRTAAPWWERLGGSAAAAALLIRDEPDPALAAADADLLSESVVERVEVKRAVLARFDELCPPHTVFTSNSSYITPSRLAKASGREARFAALHLHVPVWFANVADVVPARKTLPAVTAALEAFVGRIGQVVVRPAKEFPGHVFNYLLQAVLSSALTLARDGIASPETIDRAWIGVTKMLAGPFGMLDRIGLDTVREILVQWAKFFPESDAGRNAEYLAEVMARDGLGLKSGRGFYSYPNPRYAAAEFCGGNSLQPLRDATVVERDVPGELSRRPVPAPLLRPGLRRPRYCGGVLVVGNGPIAEELTALLHAEGTACERVAPQSAAGDAVMELLRRVRPKHVFLTAAERDEASAGWSVTLVQEWLRTLDEPAAAEPTLVALTFLDHPAGAGQGGMFRSILAELGGGPATAVVCADAAESPAIWAERLLVEAAVAQAGIVTGNADECVRRAADLEVAWVGGERRIFRWVADQSSEKHDSAAVPERGGRWLILGADRRETTRLGLGLAAAYGSELLLYGEVALPAEDAAAWSPERLAEFKADVMRRAVRARRKPNVAWEEVARGIELQATLRAMTARGFRVTYRTNDLADLGAGPIEGVLFGTGAGAAAKRRFDRKTSADFEAAAGPLRLADRLAEILGERVPRYWVHCGSPAGHLGASGRADVAAAEAEAVAWCECFALRRPGCRVVSIAGPFREEERGIDPTAGLAAWEPDDRLARLLLRPTVRTAGAEVKMSSECGVPGAFLAAPDRPGNRA